MSNAGGNQRTSGRRRRMILWIAMFILGGIGWVVAVAALNPAYAWRAVLSNFLFFTSLTGGLVVWSAVMLMSNAKWVDGLEKIALAGISFALPSLAVLAALWAGSSAWSPWYGKTPPQGFWLDNGFVFARDLGSLALFWIVAYVYVRGRRRGRNVKAAGWLILVYFLVYSLLGFDLVMSLGIKWHSALFGGYFVASALYIAAAAWAFMAAWRPKTEPEQLHDLGNLTLGFAMITTYFMFCQLLTIWYENLPHEVQYIVPRFNYAPGKWVSWALVAVIYLGPMAYLAPIRFKTSRRILGFLAAVLLAGLWLERWWLVFFTFSKTPPYGLSEIASTVAFIGLCAFCLDFMYPRIPDLHGKADEQ